MLSYPLQTFYYIITLLIKKEVFNTIKSSHFIKQEIKLK